MSTRRKTVDFWGEKSRMRAIMMPVDKFMRLPWVPEKSKQWMPPKNSIVESITYEDHFDMWGIDEWGDERRLYQEHREIGIEINGLRSDWRRSEQKLSKLLVQYDKKYCF
jgi:hypothetical protein